MAKIIYVQDKDNVIFYPVTHERAVRDNNNVNLETKLGQKQDTLVSGTSIKTINHESLLGSGNITLSTDTSDCEHLANKSLVITDLSTDEQYPSSKSVYTFVGAYVDEATQNLVSYPTFQINSNMHLTMSSPDAAALSLFSVNDAGHLIMTV